MNWHVKGFLSSAFRCGWSFILPMLWFKEDLDAWAATGGCSVNSLEISKKRRLPYPLFQTSSSTYFLTHIILAIKVVEQHRIQIYVLVLHHSSHTVKSGTVPLCN